MNSTGEIRYILGASHSTKRNHSASEGVEGRRELNGFSITALVSKARHQKRQWQHSKGAKQPPQTAKQPPQVPSFWFEHKQHHFQRFKYLNGPVAATIEGGFRHCNKPTKKPDVLQAKNALWMSGGGRKVENAMTKEEDGSDERRKRGFEAANRARRRGSTTTSIKAFAVASGSFRQKQEKR